MKNYSKRAFDFDELSQFARTDPSKFAESREDLISEFLEKANLSEDLLELQNRINTERYRVGLGMPSCYSHMDSLQAGIEQLKVLLKQLERKLLDASLQ